MNDFAYIFDKKAASRAVNFIEKHIRHVKGEMAGQPFILEDWQKTDIVEPLFGWKDPATGLRRFRTAYIELPRKNGKSNLSAAIALYLLFADGEKGAEVYSAAGNRDQAAIVFEIAKQMIIQDETLQKLAGIFKRSITFEQTASYYQVVSADADTKHGANSHGVIFDEIHVQTNRDLWDVYTTSVGSRAQPLIIGITTAGWNKQSICYELHDYAEKVRDGVIEDPTFLPVIYAAAEADDFRLESTWKKANPGFGTIVKREYIAKEAKKADELPSYENTFRRLHLNQWTTSETKWLSDEMWLANSTGPIDPDEFKGMECYGGLDLSTVRDITALSLLFHNDKTSTFTVIPYFFVPEETIFIRTRKENVPYEAWEKEGYIIATPGDVIDYRWIYDTVLKVAEKYNLKKIAFDRWNSSQLVNDLVEEGIKMEPYGQGYASMSTPTKELEKIVVSHQLQHGENPVLRWMCSNVMLKPDPAGNIKIDKSKSTEKVDGMVALVMALGAYLADKDKGLIYNERGMRFI